MIGDVVVRIAADTGNFERGLGRANNKLSGFKSAIGGASLALSATFAGAAVAATAGISTIVNESAKFQTAFTGLQKTTEASAATFKKLEKGIIDMSKQVPASAAEIADVAAVAGQLGIKSGDILKFTRTMVDMGEATNMTSVDAAKSLARFANIMDMPINNVDKLASTVVHLGNNFATTEKEIVEMGLRIAGAGKVVGFTESEVMSLAAAMSSLGIRTEAGGSAASRVLLKINDAVISGSDHLGLYAKLAGVTSNQFKKLWKNSPADAFNEVVKGLSKMHKEGKDVNGMLGKLELSDIRIKDAMLRLAGAQNIYTNALKKGRDAWKKNVALQNEVAIRYQDFANLLKMVRNRLMSVVLVIGKPMLKVLSDMLNALDPLLTKIEKLADKFYYLSDSTKETVAKIMLAVPAFLLLASGVFAVFGGLLLFNVLLGYLGVTLGGLVAITTGVVVVFTGLITTVQYVRKNFDSLKESIGKIGNAFYKAFYNIKQTVESPLLSTSEKIDEILKSILGAFGTFGEELGKIVGGIAMTFVRMLPDSVVNFVYRSIDKLRSKIKELEDVGIKIKDVFNAVAGPITTLGILIAGLSGPIGIAIGAFVFLATKTEFLTDMIKMFKGEMTFEEVIDNLGEMITAFVEDFQKLIDIAMPIFVTFIEGLGVVIAEGIPIVVEAIMGLIMTIVELLPDFIEAGIGMVIALIEGIVEALPILTEAIFTMVDSILETILENVPKFLEAMEELISRISETLIENGPRLVETFIVILDSLLTTIAEVLPQFVESAVEIVLALVQGITEMLSSVNESGSNLTETLVDGLIKVLPIVSTAALDIILALVNGLLDALPKLIDAALDLIMAIVDTLLNSLDKIIDAGTRLLEGLIKGMLDRLPDLLIAVGKILAKLLITIIKAIPKLIDAGVDLLLALIKGIVQTGNQLMDAAGQLTLRFVKEILSFIGDMLNAGIDLMSSLIEGINGKIDDGIAAVGKFLNGQIKEAMTFVADFMSIGGALIKGLVQGIANMKDAAIDKVKEVGGAIKKTLTSFFSIKSPSRVMRNEVGKQIVAGLIVGMDKQINPLVRMARKVSEAAKPDIPSLDDFEVGDVRGHAKKVTGRLSVKSIEDQNGRDRSGINQTVNIHSNTPLSPSEAARKQKQASQKWALEMGF